jgi:S1-C subfamily serine protease
MNKKTLAVIILCSLVFGALGSWVFNRYLLPKLSTVPFLIKYNLAPAQGPLVINTRQEVHVNDGTDLVAAVQNVKPWTVAILALPSAGNVQVLGSGLLLTSDGLIATTKSAVAGQSKIWVKTIDGSVAQATIQSQDSESDLVFIQAPLKNQPTASFDDPNNLELGDSLVIVSQSTGQNQAESQVSYVSSETRNTPSNIVLSSDQISRTFGISSSSLSSSPVTQIAEGAAIAASDGNVEGIYSKTGIIVAGTIQSALSSYFNNNKQIVRPSIGLYYEYISPDIAEITSSHEGAKVVPPNPKTAAVVSGSPAQQAGLQEGDIIYQVDGTAVTDSNSFESLLSSHNPNDVLTLNIWRGGKSIVVTVIVKAK